MIHFTASKAEFVILQGITERAMVFLHRWYPNLTVQDVLMDLEACHSNGCPLDLASLLIADDPHFYHDVMGIVGQLDRTTGKLPEHWRPRHALVQVTVL